MYPVAPDTAISILEVMLGERSKNSQNRTQLLKLFKRDSRQTLNYNNKFKLLGRQAETKIKSPVPDTFQN